MRKWILKTALLLGCLTATISCAKDEHEVKPEPEVQYKAAVIMPLNADDAKKWAQIAEWFRTNLERAQDGFQRKISLDLDWYDENTLSDEALKTLGQELAHSDDVLCVIGPSTSSHVRIVAQGLSQTKKMMLSPTATSAEVLREYSGKGFFWSLCESDITQCEVLLTKARSYGAKTVSLLANDTDCGSTFRDWFAFQATEMGMEPVGLHYINEVKEALDEHPDYIICAPDGVSDVLDIIAKGKASATQPHFLFSGIALDPMLLELSDELDQIEGTSTYADPATGFSIAYNVRYDEYAAMGEAQFYDALLLAALVAQQYDSRVLEGALGDDINLQVNDCMKSLMALSGADGGKLPVLSAWNIDGLRRALSQPLSYNISGASSNLDFDVNLQSSVTRSVYCHWLVYRGNMVPVDYLATDGSRNTSSIAAAWDWQAKVMQEIGDVDTENEYPEMRSQWAVLVCGSKGWSNYRHESDVLNMYDLLKANGYDDDHIILIATPEEIAYHSNNLYPGVIRGSVNGPNLFNAPLVDYVLDELSAEDICSILKGEKSPTLPIVLETDAHSNILLYWSGHGNEAGYFRWDGVGGNFTRGMIQDAVRKMSQEKRFRKLLVCSEPCYSASVLKGLEGVKGVLGIASANSEESSFADVFDTELSVWLSDRFSNQLVSSVRLNPDKTFWDLYLDLVHNTYGSHVTIVNYPLFDNLHKATTREFFFGKVRAGS